jgi:hypothetical protein
MYESSRNRNLKLSVISIEVMTDKIIRKERSWRSCRENKKYGTHDSAPEEHKVGQERE